MTELEKRLTEALKALSAQYEREQQRQADVIEGLAESVESLRGQVERQSATIEGLAESVERWKRQLSSPSHSSGPRGAPGAASSGRSSGTSAGAARQPGSKPPRR